ncbi:hypothetical protein HanIR_Chr07g0308621 [Helianthus annuus]|nr:hypothetical protein HanIR_Chr07g0308621 [Helianthus annuus]
MAVTNSECCFGDVLISDSQLMVSRSQINLGVIARPLQLVEQVVNTWKRITILHNHIVKLAIVNTHPESTVFLLHKQDCSSPGRRARTYETLFQEFL